MFLVLVWQPIGKKVLGLVDWSHNEFVADIWGHPLVKYVFEVAT